MPFFNEKSYSKSPLRPRAFDHGPRLGPGLSPSPNVGPRALQKSRAPGRARAGLGPWPITTSRIEKKFRLNEWHYDKRNYLPKIMPTQNYLFSSPIQYISLSICLWVDPFEGQANSQNLGMQKPISKMFWGWKNEQFLCHPLMGRDFSLIFFFDNSDEWMKEWIWIQCKCICMRDLIKVSIISIFAFTSVEMQYTCFR